MVFFRQICPLDNQIRKTDKLFNDTTKDTKQIHLVVSKGVRFDGLCCDDYRALLIRTATWLLTRMTYLMSWEGCWTLVHSLSRKKSLPPFILYHMIDDKSYVQSTHDSTYE